MHLSVYSCARWAILRPGGDPHATRCRAQETHALWLRTSSALVARVLLQANGKTSDNISQRWRKTPPEGLQLRRTWTKFAAVVFTNLCMGAVIVSPELTDLVIVTSERPSSISKFSTGINRHAFPTATGTEIVPYPPQILFSLDTHDPKLAVSAPTRSNGPEACGPAAWRRPMSVFDEYVHQNHPLCAERLVAARKRLQTALPQLENQTGSIYANILGAITCSQLQEGVRKVTGLICVSPLSATKGDILFSFLDVSHRDLCDELRVLPLGRDDVRSIFRFAAVNPTVASDPRFKSILVNTPFSSLAPSVSHSVPIMHLQNFWDTTAWLASFNRFTVDGVSLPLAGAGVGSYPFYPRLRRLDQADFERKVSGHFASALLDEGLRLGTTREARRILRTLGSLLRTEQSLGILHEKNHPYCTFIVQLLQLLAKSIAETTPQGPALFALQAVVASQTKESPLPTRLGEVSQHIDRILEAANVDDEETQKHINRILESSRSLIVFGCPSLVVRSALNLAVLMYEPETVTFVFNRAMMQSSAFRLTSRAYAEFMGALADRGKTRVECISLDVFASRCKAGQIPRESCLLAGVMHFLPEFSRDSRKEFQAQDVVALCERGIGEAIGTALPGQAYALAGSKAKRLMGFPELRVQLRDLVTTHCGSYLRTALREYEIIPNEAFMMIYM